MRDAARASLRAFGRAAPAAAAVGLLLAFNAAFTPGFFDLTTVEGRLAGSTVDVLNRGAVVVLLALGMAIVIATGGVDLSVGAVMAIAGATAATLAARHGVNAWSAIAAAVAVGAAAGSFNGALVAGAGVQPIVATLVLMVAGRGAAQLLTGGQIVTFNDPVLNFLDAGFIAGAPMPVLIAAAALALSLLLTRGTALGLFIEAAGDNERAARLAGVRVRAVKAAAYVLCGAAAAVAGLLAASDIRAADANNAGLYLELDAILAAVLGGTALRGGRFSLFGAALGALFIQGLTTTLYLHDVSPNATLVVKAAAVLAVCLAASERVRAWIKHRSRP
ncbi:MAG: ABC transporter permease [Phycisphaerales bacterium]|nr:ABC transporter permease [Phycisphaerales bacterium]